MTNAVFKKGQTTKIRVRVETITAPLNAVNLTGKTLIVKAENGVVPLVLTSTLEAQAGATLGYFNFTCTPGNLTTLGNPAQVTVVPTLWNADDTIFGDIDPLIVAVEL